MVVVDVLNYGDVGYVLFCLIGCVWCFCVVVILDICYVVIVFIEYCMYFSYCLCVCFVVIDYIVFDF